MLAIQIDLLAGRYHATQWGRAANEGIPEWPPSPWRLARALVSAWWLLPPERRPPEHVVDKVLAEMGPPPRIALPRGVAAQTRHYMPRPADKDKATLVLDPFVRTEGEPLAFLWDNGALDGEPRAALALLLEGLGYIGRAESPCTGRLVDVEPKPRYVSAPLVDPEAVGESELVRVLCLTPQATLAELSQSTGELRRRRILHPPCGRFVAYVLPARALEAPRPTPRQSIPRRPVALRFALESAAPPPVTRTLEIAELFRAAALSRAGGSPPDVIRRLRGRADGDDAIASGHRHAHYLPSDEDGDRRIDHLTVWCPDGLEETELRALDLGTLTSWRLDHPLRLVLLDVIDEEGALRARVGPLASGRVWRSQTPFLPVRHPKRRNGDTVDGWEEQVVLELERRALPPPQRILRLRTGPRAWGEYRRERRGASHRLRLPALGFELEFDEPIDGPLALGRNSHFGMGLFLPIAET